MKRKLKKQPSKSSHQEEKTPRLLRGMKDILPEEQRYWRFILDQVKKISQIYGFEEISTPILEKSFLFERAVGENTDIIEKEMYTFEDQGGEKITLRPEFTASIARAYIEHGMINSPQPIKLCSFGPTFRYNRPQAGRYRQFHQLNLEVLGSKDPIIDAQIILIANVFLQGLGLKINIEINSLGCQNCRKGYRKAFLDFYRNKKNLLCSDCQKRLVQNPLRILDCKKESCQRVGHGVPQMVDFLCEECKNHFIKVLEYLDELEISYNLNSRLVRGLDYYGKTVFEFFSAYIEDSIPRSSDPSMGTEEMKAEFLEDGYLISAQNSLGGGGRYDQLIELLGGRETPACGIALGIERIILEMKKRGVAISKKERSDVFLAQLGEQAKKKALLLFENLREKRIKVVENFSKDSLKTQLEMADRLGVKLCLILGQKEILDNTILIRDMEGGAQETVKFDKVMIEIKKRLKKKQKSIDH